MAQFMEFADIIMDFLRMDFTVFGFTFSYYNVLFFVAVFCVVCKLIGGIFNE